MPSTSLLDKAAKSKYMDLKTNGITQAMYIWIDGSGESLRCKTRSLEKEPKTIEGQSIWTILHITCLSKTKTPRFRTHDT